MSRYANPDFLLNGMIESGRLFEFVLEFIDLDNERQQYEYWLHRVFDKSFEEFKKQFEPKRTVPAENLETTIKDSQNILSSFVPG